ncbi:MAG: insulinase family protein [Clostridia bacterium]|nr:insulinase family protein [Clostridia bacterium]
MNYFYKYDNGLKIVIAKMEGYFSVSCGVLVKTGSINENEANNGISHFIEHTMFKGTKKRSAFEISDYIDRIGAQINAYTSKEMTCYYTKSTGEHLFDSLEVLSDIFFNSKFEQSELDKEKGVVIEEINMCEDAPEEVCLDLLSESRYGKTGLGQTILGKESNILGFTKKDIKKYMDKYYTADNVVIAIAGDVDVKKAKKYIDELFANNFSDKKGKKQNDKIILTNNNLYKTKKIEQTHIAFSMPAINLNDDRSDVFNIANSILGGGMSSRLFQKIREELGLCYSIYSYVSQYKYDGVLEIYAGVNTKNRDLAVNSIVETVRNFKKDKITKQEFMRGKEQIKSAFIMSRESTTTQMLLYGRYLLFLDKEFNYKERMKILEKTTLNDVNDIIDEYFDIDKASTATVGSKTTAIKIK